MSIVVEMRECRIWPCIDFGSAPACTSQVACEVLRHRQQTNGKPSFRAAGCRQLRRLADVANTRCNLLDSWTPQTFQNATSGPNNARIRPEKTLRSTLRESKRNLFRVECKSRGRTCIGDGLGCERWV